jgi:hypothetical protein
MDTDWIDVEDALPETSRDVLILHGKPMKRRVSIGMFVEKYTMEPLDPDSDSNDDYRESDDTYWLKSGWYEMPHEIEMHAKLDHVTHWMEIPNFGRMYGNRG